MKQCMSYWYQDLKNNVVYINIKVKAGAKANKIVGISNINTKAYLSLQVSSIPENNKANKVIIRLLSEWLKVPKTNLIITYGLKYHLKVIKLISNNPTLIISKLQEYQLRI